MKRRLFTILSALSLVLCLATGALWACSYWESQGILDVSHDEKRYLEVYLDCERGTVSYCVIEMAPSSLWSAHIRGLRWTHRPAKIGALPGNKTWWNRRGFYWQLGSSPDARGFWSCACIVPCWLVTLLAGVMPAVWVHRFWRSRRRRFREQHGLCRVCGYDLRASPERCPECGTAVPSAKPENAT